MLVNKKAIAIAFGRAAKSYSRHDSLQRRSALSLRRLLGASSFTTVLDAGCGPGEDSCAWRTFDTQVTAIDLSLEMLRIARKRQAADSYLIADIEALPLPDACFDLVWSHLAVQWCTNLGKALRELYRVARPGGLVAFTTLLDRSLLELYQAWRTIDTYSHINRFLSQTEVMMILSPWRHRYSVQSITLRFGDALSAIRSLKGIGATHLHDQRTRKALTRGDLQRLSVSWPLLQNQFPLTYHLFHGIIERD